MCDMAALSSLQPTNLQFTLVSQTSTHAGKTNEHGWGLALYPDDGDAVPGRKPSKTKPRGARVFKEPIAARSEFARFVGGAWQQNAMRSRTFILHFRYSTGTVRAYRNTHPFERELWGRSFVLAHNGSYEKVQWPGTFEAIGDTDSEQVFCAILNWLVENVRSKAAYDWMTPSERGQRIHDAILAVAPDKTKNLNLFVSDGETLVAHCRYLGNPMFFQVRGPGFSAAYIDPRTRLTLGVEKGPSDLAVLVVTGDAHDGTHPPGNAGCEPIPQGESLVLHEGAIVARTWEGPIVAELGDGFVRLKGDVAGPEFQVEKAPEAPPGAREYPVMVVGAALGDLAGMTLTNGSKSLICHGIARYPAYDREALAPLLAGDHVVLLNAQARQMLGIGDARPWRLAISVWPGFRRPPA